MSHEREEGKRTLASTAKAIVNDGNFIGTMQKFNPNPEFLKQRSEVWD